MDSSPRKGVIAGVLSLATAVSPVPIFAIAGAMGMSGHSAAPLFVVLVVPLALVPLIGVLLAAVAWFRGAKLLGLAGALLSLASPSTAAGCSLAIRWWTRPYVDAPSASAGDAFTLGHFPVRSVHIRVT